ncbi:hypothetical protein T10_9099 [Trichinella papuae]|uniref:Uncharacterized protein n=1 Tax=Trichinella papuae TaxID=268474 RepID=A0A0V1MT74_9BILA|nr:hypothetical protein T10_9099 [Trichinella papuae]
MSFTTNLTFYCYSFFVILNNSISKQALNSMIRAAFLEAIVPKLFLNSSLLFTLNSASWDSFLADHIFR